MEQNIPIDVQTSKLLDWLISRRHCDKSWPQQVQAVREKINSAIQDMPEHLGITKLLTGTYINYFHCLQIIEILKETEADTRSLFGRYGSQRMKDWQDVVRSYESHNVFLAEAAQILMRNVAYEVPGIKKAIARCEQIQHETERREAECVKHAQEFRDKYLSLCQQLGIQGKEIKKELVQLLSGLPHSYKDIAKQTKKISKACDHYQDFVKHIVAPDTECLPLLKYIIEHGNTTVYEWRYGEAPLRIEEPPLLIDVESKETVEEDQIDFGDIDLNAEVELETGDIDWGQIDMLNDAHEVLEIDFTGVDETGGIVVQEDGVEGGVAKENEALTLLDYHKTRNVFVDDLLELEAFLRQRLLELQSKSGSQGQVGFSLSQSDSCADVSIEQLSEMLSSVGSVLDSISSMKLKHLALIRESPRYVDRLANSLQQHMKLADKMVANQKSAAEKRKATAVEQSRLQPLLKRLVEQTKQLQAQVEQQISKKYNNRPVHITGGITTL